MRVTIRLTTFCHNDDYDRNCWTMPWMRPGICIELEAMYDVCNLDKLKSPRKSVHKWVQLGHTRYTPFMPLKGICIQNHVDRWLYGSGFKSFWCPTIFFTHHHYAFFVIPALSYCLRVLISLLQITVKPLLRTDFRLIKGQEIHNRIAATPGGPLKLKSGLQIGRKSPNRFALAGTRVDCFYTIWIKLDTRKKI